MRLQELLAKHPEVSLATAADNNEIISFFDSFPMSGKGLKLQYQRSPDFFRFLKMHSDEAFVFILKERDRLQGVGTLIIRKGFINGEIVPVGYLGDLRVRQGKRSAVIWRKFYLDLMASSSTIEEFHGAQHFITAVIDSNLIAQKALISNKNLFSYHHLTDYQMINVFGRRPCLKTRSSLEVRTALASDEASIRKFWLEEESLKQFGSPDLFDHALATWDGFSIEDVIVCLKEGKIVGICGLWYPGKSKRIVIKSYPFHMKLLALVLKLRPSSFPSEGAELRPLYLTHLNYSEPSILTEMLTFILKLPKAKAHHMIVLPSFPALKTSEALKPFLYEAVPMGLYQVYIKEKPEVIIRPGLRPPGFEMALV